MTQADRDSLRILVTGCRRWDDVGAVRHVLLQTWSRLGPNVPASEVTIVTGACPTGADAIAEKWAHMVGAKIEQHPANWGESGAAAGPMRNELMVNAGADICVAFWTGSTKGSGTHDCFTRAARAGIPIFIVPWSHRRPRAAQEGTNA